MADGVAGDLKLGLDLEVASAEQSLKKLTKTIADSMNTGDKSVDVLNKRLGKTTNKINDQIKKLEDLKSKLKDLESGNGEVKGTAPLQKQLEKTREEIEKTKAKLAELKAQEASNTVNIPAQRGVNVTGQVPAQPSGKGSEVAKLQSDIATTEKKLAELEQKAAETSNKLKEAFASGTQSEIEKTKNKIQQTSDNLKVTTTQAEQLQQKINDKTMPKSVDNISKAFGKLGHRIAGLVKRVFFFSLITLMLRNLRKALGGIFKQNSALQASIDRLKNALWTLAVPLYNYVIPAFTVIIDIIGKVIMAISQLISLLTGKGWSATVQQAKNMKDLAKETDKSGAAAKKLNDELEKQVASFDELNILSSQESDDSSSGGGGSTEPTNFNLPETSGMLNTLDEILGVVELIGVAFASWKFGGIGAIGSIAFFSDLQEFLDVVEKLKDEVEQNGKPNVSTLFEFVGELGQMIADLMIMTGNLKVGAVIGMISSIIDIIGGIKRIEEEGLNKENVLNVLDSVSEFFFYLGIYTKNWALVGVMATLQLALDVIENWDKLVKAIKDKNWGEIPNILGWSDIILGVGGLILTIGAVIRKIKKSKLKKSKVGEAFDPVNETIDSANTKTGTLTNTLKKWIKNLALGIVIIAEIGVAVGLFVAEIWAIGWGLSQIVTAWKPAIDNWDSILFALENGTVLLVAVGLIVGGLGAIAVGSFGTIALAILAGMGILAEVGLAVAEYLGEVYLIGIALADIAVKWQPAIDKKSDIDNALKTSNELLFTVGTVCAALGAMAIGTFGTVALAIWAGVKILEQCTDAVASYIDSTIQISDKLALELAPTLATNNSILAELKPNLTAFVDFMEDFAKETVRYTESTAIAGFEATIDAFVKIFTKDPIKAMIKDVKKTGENASGLNEKLKVANPELETAVELLTNYVDYIDELGKLASSGGTVELSEGLKVNLEDVGAAIVTGFVDGIVSKQSDLTKSIEDWADNVTDHFTKKSYGNINSEAFKDIAEDIIDSNGFNKGITNKQDSAKTTMLTLAKNIISSFKGEGNNGKEGTGINNETFKKIAQNAVDGVNDTFKSLLDEQGSFNSTISSLKTLITDLWVDYDWSKSSWQTGLYSGILGVFTSLSTAIKGPLKSIIQSTQRMANSVIDGVKAAINALNKVDYKLPDGKSFSINIPTGSLSHVSLSTYGLATGAVLPPNKPFLAMVGDQKQGTNIEAPLDTIVEAMNKSLDARGNNSFSGTIEIPLILNNREVGRGMLKAIDLEKARTTGTKVNTRLVFA